MEVYSITKPIKPKICSLKEKFERFEKSNQDFYTILRPTLFFLRFFGGPLDLWRSDEEKPLLVIKLGRVASVVILFLVNFGAVADLASTMVLAQKPNRDFSDNLNLFYIACLNITGALALDILWWRRRMLRQLLKEIGMLKFI